MTQTDCAICGAKVSPYEVTGVYNCRFCHFRHHPQTSAEWAERDRMLILSLEDLPDLRRLKTISQVAIEGLSPSVMDQLPHDDAICFTGLMPEDSGLDAIWADMILPFEANLSQYFHNRFHQLRSGGLLYLSTPVEQPFRTTDLLPGQLNFFQPRNIMFLLEQRGFKMAWRKNRFSQTLRIIARKD